MAKTVHYVEVSAFAKEAGSDIIGEALAAILPAGIRIEEKAIEPETEGGVFTAEMYEHHATIKKATDIRDFISRLLSGLDEYDRKWVAENVERSVDEDCNFYLRLSKEEAVKGEYVLESKDPIHVRIKMAAYPADRKNALKAALAIISDELH